MPVHDLRAWAAIKPDPERIEPMNDNEEPPQFDYYEEPPLGYQPRDVFGVVALAALSAAVMVWIVWTLLTWVS
jgi:hypothetical protein